MLFNWGAKYFVDKAVTTDSAGNSAGYMILGQAGLNQNDVLFRSLYYNLLANSYTDDEKVNVYHRALEFSDINLDSYDALITLYKTTGKTSSEWHALAEKIIDAYTYYPMAMYDLLKVVKPYLRGADLVDIDLREHVALISASRVTDADVLQSGPMREIANVLLGRTKVELATFSFDGENAGKIVIDSSYELHDFNLYYSIDGGVTFSEKTTSHVISLSEDVLSRITPENDIRIYMDRTPQVYTIDIEKATISSNLYANDLENRVVGVDLTYEWRNDENDSWTPYAAASPDNTGNKTLQVRVGRSGRLTPSDVVTYTFTEDNQPNIRKYVPVSHLSIEDYSTQSIDTARPFYAPNAIDGNGNTLWHTDFRENVLTQAIKPFITIRLDKPRYISALEFKQLQYKASDPIYIKSAKVYVSEDGEDWILAGSIENCSQDTELKDITFAESIYGEYIKIEMDTYGMFACLSLVNVFQDMTKSPRPTAGIGYSITTPTKENVITRLTNVSVSNYDIIDENGNIITNGGDSYLFTDNGTHIFRFRDRDTNVVGTAKAVVDWIDRKAPTGTILYSTTSKTNQSVIATLQPSEDVVVINNSSYQVDVNGNVLDENGNVIANINSFTYEFLSNGEFTFEFVDKAGNRGYTTAKVDWIDHDRPEATFTYDVVDLTNQNVTVTIEFDEEAIVSNNEGKRSYVFTNNGEFTFTFQDLAGNVNQATARVDWIDKVVPTVELAYDKTSSKKAIITVINASEEIVFQNGNGIYTFEQNGTYEITFMDKAGNIGKVMAIVDWLEDENPIDPDDEDDHFDIPDESIKPNPKPITPNRPSTGNNQSSNFVGDEDSSEAVDPIPDEGEDFYEIDDEPTPDDEKEDENPNNSDNSNVNQIESKPNKGKIVIPVVVTTVVVLGIGFLVVKKV